MATPPRQPVQPANALLSCGRWGTGLGVVSQICIPAVNLLTALTIVTLLVPQAAEGQRVLSVLERKRVTGTVASIRPGQIKLRLDSGETELPYLIQDKSERAISVEGQPTRFAAKINVQGTLPIKLIEPGMLVAFSTNCNLYGKSEAPLANVKVLADHEDPKLKVDFKQRPKKNSDFAAVDIVGRVRYIKGRRFQIEVPRAKWALLGKMTFDVTPDATFDIRDDSLGRVQPGDEVTRATVVRLTDKTWAVYSIDIQLKKERAALTVKFADKLENKFSHLSNDPGQPREVRSQHFLLRTDVSEREAQILLAKLETMFELVSSYFRAKPNSLIQCVVVKDIRKWDVRQFPRAGLAKILEPAGVTISQSSGGITSATVYSCDNHGVVQHEAVHAFCYLTFGATGPVWYSEGMAEMGHYWKPGNLEVQIDPVVIDFLTNATPKRLAEIVKPGQVTGDSWKAYAWRWALCHLLASNPNYSKRFKELGVKLMTKQPDSFENAFGKHRDQISFEYDQFVKNFGNGYRVDLCAWDWRARAKPLTPGNRIKHTIKAKAGWQATKLKAEKGKKYDLIAEGEWQTGPDLPVDANGDAAGRGKLIGVILSDFQLSDPFELGQKGSFVAPANGQLFVRCRDDWTQLSDNDGMIKLHLRPTPKSTQ